VDVSSRQPTADCYSGDCFLSNRVILVKDAEKVEKAISTNREVREGIKSFGLVPIAIEDEVMGVLACASKRKKGFFTEEYLDFMEALGQQCAMAIRNARLYEKTKDFSSQLEKEIEKRTEELREKTRLLSQSEKLAALGEMADRVAHETRNPIVTIGGFARRIHRKIDPGDPLKHDIAIIIKEVERLEKMVYWITEYKKYISTDFQPTNINLIIDEALEGLQNRIEEKAVRIRKDFLPGPPLVRVDRKNMVFVFFNLFENGIEAMDPEGVLHITTRMSRDDYLEVIVSDTGKGIEEKELESIYNPFYTSKMSGAGMGLTITHKIVKDHNGLIKVHSEVGEGTTFFVQLPVMQTATENEKGTT
jgi:signal transduction histidine kinase